jgi:biopolymer transport protein ExbD
VTASHTRPHEATFDLTPMIDVVLLLIIFFMLSSQFAQVNLKPLALPQEQGERGPESASSTIVIDLDDKGEISVFGKVVDPAALRSVLGDHNKQGDASEVPTCVVRADRRCTAGHLNDIAAALAAAGVRQWRLATVPGGADRQ